jgi:hypothetical protein
MLSDMYSSLMAVPGGSKYVHIHLCRESCLLEWPCGPSPQGSDGHNSRVGLIVVSEFTAFACHPLPAYSR